MGPVLVPALVFFGVATVFGCLFRAFAGARLRAAARRPGATDGDLCSLRQANRISSVAVVTSVIGLVGVGLAGALLT